jgi:hypothetical protein
MSEQFEAIFAHLRGVYAGYEKRCTVMADQPGKYYLGTHAVRAKDGYRTWFGGVEIKKNYVSAHLVPVYACPDLLDAVSPQLRKRMQGKSCFNFKKLEPALLDEFAQLADAGAERFRQKGWI